MIDLHCHILPGIDDGCPDIETSLAMAAMAEESGVTDIACTSHYQYALAESEGLKEKYMLLTALMQDKLAGQGIGVRLHGGSEVLCTEETPELLSRGLLPMIGKTDYLLVEFRFHTPVEDIDDMLDRLKAEGARIILAHPERYLDVQRNRHYLVKWFREGTVLQCNKGSILGALGGHAMKTSRWMLDHGLAHIVASDAHTATVRTPRMTELWDALVRHWGEEYAEVLLNINPGRILAGKDILSPDGEED